MSRPKRIGTYDPPRVSLGARVYCRYRKTWCRVVGWSKGPIRWPRVRREKGSGGGQHGLRVDATLVAAIRIESPAALVAWFGVAERTAVNWRRAVGVQAPRREPKPDQRAERCARPTAAATRLGVQLSRAILPEGWKPEELALLGTDHDEVITGTVNRSANAVRVKRRKLRITVFRNRRGRNAR